MDNQQYNPEEAKNEKPSPSSHTPLPEEGADSVKKEHSKKSHVFIRSVQQMMDAEKQLSLSIPGIQDISLDAELKETLRKWLLVNATNKRLLKEILIRYDQLGTENTCPVMKLYAAEFKEIFLKPGPQRGFMVRLQATKIVEFLYHSYKPLYRIAEMAGQQADADGIRQCFKGEKEILSFLEEQ